MATTPTIQTSQVAVGTAAVQLTQENLENGVTIKSMAANTGKIYIGRSNGVLTTTGYELSPGQSITVSVVDASTLWAISDTAAQNVCLLGN